MFKKGQLVQSVKYGDHYVVVSASHLYARCIPLTKKFWFSDTMLLEPERLRLIGNNYQPKPQHGDGGEW